jgi:hypothetical protein
LILTDLGFIYRRKYAIESRKGDRLAKNQKSGGGVTGDIAGYYRLLLHFL